MLIGDEIGDAPRQEAERLSGEAEWFVSGDSWFHNRSDSFTHRSLHGRPGFSQGLNGSETLLVGHGLKLGGENESVTVTTPYMMGWMRQR